MRFEPDVRTALRLAAGVEQFGYADGFAQPSIESVLGGVRRAFSTFVSTERLDVMRRSAMARSFSWDLSAALYSALYRKAMSA